MTTTANNITIDLGCTTSDYITTTNSILPTVTTTPYTTSTTGDTISLAYPTHTDDFYNKVLLNKKTITESIEQCIKATKESNPWAYDTTLKIKVPYIEDVKILCPNKVLQFTFKDGTIIKTICLDSDQFDFEFAFYLAYAKYLWQKVLTPAGIERKAREYTETKFFVKLVNTAFKTINKKQKEEEKLAKEKKEKKAIAERHAAKKTAKAKKQREARIMETVEAIKRAKQ